MNNADTLLLKKLVGPIMPEQAINADCYLSENLGVFIPVTGPCLYSITPRHTHPSYLFVLSYDERSDLIVQGKRIPQQVNRMCAISPDIEHQEVLLEDFSRFIAIVVRKEFYESERMQYASTPPGPFRGEYFPIPERLTSLIKDFMNELESHNAGSERMCNALALAMTHLIIRATENIATSTRNHDLRFEIDRAITWMHTNSSSPFSLPQTAQHVCMSPSHFSRTFKKETGLSPVEYLNDLRLKKARKMLRTTSSSITEIALACGFSTSAWFSTSFARKFGLSPTAFKKRMSQKTE